MAGNSVTEETIDREVHGQTVVSRFLGTVAAHPDHVALHWKERTATSGPSSSSPATRAKWRGPWWDCSASACVEAIGWCS